MGTVKRAVLYARVSTLLQADFGVSLEMQEELARRHCAREGWEFCGLYTDTESGRRDARPELLRMEKDAEGGEFEVVLIYKTDRLARSLLRLLQIAADFHDRGIGLVSLTEPIDFTTPMGKALLAMLGAFAEMESQNTSRRVKDAMRHRAARTGKHAGPTPDGYKRMDDGTLVPCPVRGPLIAEIFDRFLEARSIRGVVVAMNQSGRLASTGVPWRAATLGFILANPVYAGRLTYGRHDVLKSSKGSKKRKKLSPDEWIVVEGAHAPLVPPEVFDQVQAILAERRKVHARVLHGREVSAWAGLVRCAACGGSMTLNTRKGWAYYRCTLKRMAGGQACPEAATISLGALNGPGVDALARALNKAVSAAAKQAKPGKKRPGPVDDKAERIKALERAIVKERDLYMADAISREEMTANVRRHRDEIARLQAVSAPDAPALPPPAIGDLRALWERLTPGEQGELLRGLVERVEVQGDIARLIPRSEYQGAMGRALPFKRTLR